LFRVTGEKSLDDWKSGKNRKTENSFN